MIGAHSLISGKLIYLAQKGGDRIGSPALTEDFHTSIEFSSIPTIELIFSLSPWVGAADDICSEQTIETEWEGFQLIRLN